MGEENNKDRNRMILKLKTSNTSNSRRKKPLKLNNKTTNSQVEVSIKRKKSTIDSEVDNNLKDNNLKNDTNISNKDKEVELSLKDTPINNKENKIESYDVDNFDVRNKIKASIESTKIKETHQEEKKNIVAAEDIITQSDTKENIVNKPASKEVTQSLSTFTIKDSKSNYNKKKIKPKKENIKNDKVKKEYKKIYKEIMLPDCILVSDLAMKISEKTSEVIKKLFIMGMNVTVNQMIDADTAELIIEEFGHKAKRVYESNIEDILYTDDCNKNVEKLSRPAVVTIMGHVDHGKTSLLDCIRSTNIADKESGGITQHIGASSIKTDCNNFITFLDTPGHAAFTNMRSRGANITDIVILVVAADDGVKQQTIEAISHAKSAEVPIIVAVNKIDKPDSDPNRVKNELLNYEIVAEDIGGDAIFVEVSAKQKINIDKLLEAVLLQAELLELKAPYDSKAKGVVIETQLDSSKGVLASLLVQEGVLRKSDLVVAGTAYGKIKRMINDKRQSVKEASPSTPVEILGLNFTPEAGDKFFVIKEEKTARDIVNFRLKQKRNKGGSIIENKPLNDIFKQVGDERTKFLHLIVKGDMNGSVEAICNSLLKLNNEEVSIKIIHSATGGINDSDISLAEASNAVIIGFNVRASSNVINIARTKKIDIRYYSIIYNIIDEIKLLLGGMLNPIKNEEYLGRAEIREIIKTTNFGKIAGCFVLDGTIVKDAKIRLLRDNIVIFDGQIKTLKRFKDDVKEVKNNFEFGTVLDNYDDIKIKDLIECYNLVETKRILD